LDDTAGEEVRQRVMAGSEELTMASSREEVIAWTQEAMARLESLVDAERRVKVMTGCACQYPKSALQEAKKAYAETGDVDLVHKMLQEQFESFLRDALEVDDVMVEEIAKRGWGLAGIRRDDTIIATKIPKSGFLVDYMQQTDPAKKRAYYCHCPRVRDALKTGQTLSSTYCYCGAGFYQGIWEEILGQAVQVELLASVLNGDEVCQVAIKLP
jgi:predicted hydrocarbon binding protein